MRRVFPCAVLHGVRSFSSVPLTAPVSDAPTVRLDQFLQLAGVAGTGGQAKVLIQGGQVTVNGVVETRRRKQLLPGAVVGVGGETFEIAAADDAIGEGAA